jgi:hypothetical protein
MGKAVFIPPMEFAAAFSLANSRSPSWGELKVGNTVNYSNDYNP